MKNNKFLKIIQPDDWHVHLREGDMMKVVTNFHHVSIIDVWLCLI